MKELLEKYKNGTLTVPDEKDAFIHQLLKIRAERAQKQGNTIITPESSREAIVRPLNAFLRKVATQKFFTVAACILAACFAFWKIFAPIGESDNFLRADIITVSDNLKGLESRVRGSAITENKALVLVADLYENKDFQGIINELEGKVPINENEYLFLGLAYANIEKPNYQKVLDYFNKIKSVDYQQDVAMMKAICHIGLKQKGAARLILEQIKNNQQQGNEYRKKAGSLLEGLK